MIKIHTIVRDIVMGEIEAYVALTSGYINMSGYACRICPIVEKRAKKQVTINSLVVSLSRLKKEFRREKPLIRDIAITNITTKLPLSEIIYENINATISKLESFHKKISVTREDFFTTTIGTTELNIVCSSSMVNRVLKHFNIKPKFAINNLAAVGISFDPKHLNMPNTLFSLISVTARAHINIIELVSTYTELIFIISEKDFGKTVALFSDMHKETNEKANLKTPQSKSRWRSL